jgi:hypothetical protein
MSDTVKNAGEPRMGTEIPFENVSGSVQTIGNTRRYNERGAGGRWAPRGSTQIRPLPPPNGLVRDAVTGRMVEGPDNSMLHRMADGLAFERVHRVAPDYSRMPAISATLCDGSYCSDRRLP